ncbi:MAG: hypothetical protein Q4Q25_03515 [Methanocorpusculum sp.]|nr:hypothetical protein [Methanocorpusculum sp.]
MHPLRVALPVLSDAFTLFLHMVIRRFSTFFGSGCRGEPRAAVLCSVFCRLIGRLSHQRFSPERQRLAA